MLAVAVEAGTSERLPGQVICVGRLQRPGRGVSGRGRRAAGTALARPPSGPCAQKRAAVRRPCGRSSSSWLGHFPLIAMGEVLVRQRPPCAAWDGARRRRLGGLAGRRHGALGVVRQRGCGLHLGAELRERDALQAEWVGRPRLEGGGGEGGGGGDACRRLRRASDLPRAACWRAGRTRAQRRDFSFVAHDSPTSQTCFSLAAALPAPPSTHALLPPSPAPPAAAAVPPPPVCDAVLTTET